MNWLKKIFNKKDVEKDKEIIPQENKIEEPIIHSREQICDACKMGISGEQKSVTKAGKKYHVKPCWRNLQKMAKTEAFG